MNVTPEQVYNQYRDRISGKYIGDASNNDLRLLAKHLNVKRGSMTKEQLINIICQTAPELA